MKKIAICEDSEIDRGILITALKQYFSELNEELSIVEYISGETLLADIEEGFLLDAHLLFLDIYMGKLDGMETARRIRSLSNNIPIIFLSSSRYFALESYEVQAAGYLLKPFKESVLRELLSRTLRTERKKRVAVKVGRQYRYPYTDEILYIDSNAHTVTLHLTDGSEITTQEKLGDIEKRINERRFLRCHQSYLVNMDYITDTEDSFVMRDGSKVPVRVRGRKEIMDDYHEFFMDRFDKSKK